MTLLERAGTQAADVLVTYLATRESLLNQLADYCRVREQVTAEHFSLLRSEEEAIEELHSVSEEAPQSYRVQLAGHHKSPKAVVGTIGAITTLECMQAGMTVDIDPQSRAALLSDKHIWVSPRRLDGALPSLFNPVALWEIKEYWGKTSGGSKMSDAIYELHLVGLEVRAFEEQFGIHVNHYAIIDGLAQWTARKADFRRAIDLLYMGLLDELIIGKEILIEWPRIIRENITSAQVRGVSAAPAQEAPGMLFS